MTTLQHRAPPRRKAVAPRCLREHVTDPAVAGLRDRALAAIPPARVLARHEPDVGHQPARVLEAPEVPDLGDPPHRPLRGEEQAAERFLVGRLRRQRLDVAVQFVAAAHLLWGTVWIACATIQAGEGCVRRVRIAVRKTLTAVAFSALERGPSFYQGLLWPIASFGSPGVHSLVVGAWGLRPGPGQRWMLSPVTGPLPVRRTSGGDRT